MNQPEADILRVVAAPEKGQWAGQEEGAPRPDEQLLGEYAATRSDGVFAEIAARHAGFVYSAALRQTGNPTAAEEITQAVFVVLARKAAALRRETVLQGWLFRAVRYAAMDFRKVEVRRVQREQEAARMNATNAREETESVWEQMAPLIDEALASLSAKDRHVILLRFFQERSFREIGAALGGNENSARLRVVRALEKLRGWFQKRGVVLSAGLLSSALLIPSAQAAPPALGSLVTGAIASGHCSAAVAVCVRTILRRARWRRWPLWAGGLVVALFLAIFVTDMVREDPARVRTEVRAAVMTIDGAISFGDSDAFIAHVHFRNAEEEQFKPALAAFIRAAVRLRAQVRDRFGAQPVRGRIWLWAVEQLLSGQPRRGDGNIPAGRETDDFFQTHLLVMVKAGRAWKWDLFASLPPELARERMRILQEKTALCERATGEIQRGEIATAEQALALIQGHGH
jgi:RNA polymerase sigma factor (sigma-70 family)